MQSDREIHKYDDVLSSILVSEKSILGFLSSIFNFLARKTDFYYVPEGPYENIGFPRGVAEDLVLKVLRHCDPKVKSKDAPTLADVNNDIMCSTVAQEVEIAAEEDDDDGVDVEDEKTDETTVPEPVEKCGNSSKEQAKSIVPDDYKPPVIPTQKNSESYNGAIRDKYTWSQTIMDLDIIMNLPPDIKSSKDIKVQINPNNLSIRKKNGEVLVEDSLLHKIKASDSFWSFSDRKLSIHIDKVQERWWNKLLANEEEIDLAKIDCSRPMDELPEDHISKIRELQWNQERKMKGLPTSDQMRNIEILKKAWNAEGSPFKGTEFDPSIIQ